jgi:hypothetical protein
MAKTTPRAPCATKISFNKPYGIGGRMANVTFCNRPPSAPFGKNIETLSAKLSRKTDDPACRMAFIGSIVVHPTAKGAP